MKINIFGSVALSAVLIAFALFAGSFSPSPVMADDGGESCHDVDVYGVGLCTCREYRCTQYGLTSREGFGCYVGDSRSSVYGWDTSVNNGASWGDVHLPECQPKND